MTVPPVRLRAAAFVAAAALALAGCAAGQIAQTANEQSTIDGVNRNVGSIAIRALAIETPDGSSYAKGDSAEVKVVLVNNGKTTDSLVGISGSAITSWQSAANGAGEGTQQVTISPGSAVSYGTPDATASLRLTGLKSVLYPGNTVSLTLRFARAGSITTQVPIQLSTSAPTAEVPAPSGSSGE